MATTIPIELVQHPWLKPLGNHQESFAVIIEQDDTVKVVFYSPYTGFWGIFDEMVFDTASDARRALIRNGFIGC